MKPSRLLHATSICLVLWSLLASSVQLRAGDRVGKEFSDDRRAENAATERSIRRGIKDARRELAAGRLALEIYGFRSLNRKYLTSLEVRGIKPKVVAGCIVEPRVFGHALGFNQTMAKEIARRHGEGFLDRLDKEEEAAARAESIVPFDASAAAEAFR